MTPDAAGPVEAVLAERLTRERMVLYGYTDDDVTAVGSDMHDGHERGDYHRRAGCELTEHGWDCKDENGYPFHPIHDELDRTAEFVMWVLEHPLFAAHGAAERRAGAVEALNEVDRWVVPNGYAGGPEGDKTTAVMVRLDDLRAAALGDRAEEAVEHG